MTVKKITPRSNIRAANYEQALHIADVGQTLGFNRQIDRATVSALDKRGVNLFEFSIMHEHIAGEKVAPHVRTVALLKLVDTDVPHITHVDVTIEDWDAMENAEDAVDESA